MSTSPPSLPGLWLMEASLYEVERRPDGALWLTVWWEEGRGGVGTAHHRLTAEEEARLTREGQAGGAALARSVARAAGGWAG